MASAEYLVESEAITLLAANSTLSAATIRHQQEDDSTVNAQTKIVVHCAGKTPAFNTRSGANAPLFWWADVTVTVKQSGTETTVDSWRDAVDEALNGTTSAAGVRFFPSTGGDVSIGATDQREITRTFRALFGIAADTGEFTYLQPDGVSGYLQPDGVSGYLQP